MTSFVCITSCLTHSCTLRKEQHGDVIDTRVLVMLYLTTTKICKAYPVFDYSSNDLMMRASKTHLSERVIGHYEIKENAYKLPNTI